MFDDIETKGYGLPYLGIKPTAVGVVQVPAVAPVMPSQAFTPQPIKVPTSNQPSKVATPMPLSRPNPIQVPEPLKTAKAPMSNVQMTQQNPAQMAPPTPQIDGPTYPMLNRGLFSQVPMGGIQNGHDEVHPLPATLQPIQQPIQQPRPAFNQLAGLLNKGQMK